MAKKYALIIGIENYPKDSGQPKVNYAVNDATAMADYALQAGFHLVGGKPLLDQEAGYREVIDQLTHMFRLSTSNDFVLLYFAGHGHFSEYGGYLVPFDYKKGDTINETCCISFDSIDKRFKNKRPRNFIFFLDTCHSGYAGKQINITRAGVTRDIRVSPVTRKKIENQMEEMLHREDGSQNVGRLLFTSCNAQQKSHHIDEFQHGLFTYYLLSCLKTSRNLEKVNVDDFVRAVKDNILNYCLEHNLEQTPSSFSNIQGTLYIPVYKSKGNKGELISAPDCSRRIEAAREALKRDDFDLAARLIDETLKMDRLNPEANKLREELDTRRDTQQIKRETEKRKNYEEWLRRGEEFMKSDDFLQAKECFENAGKIYPNSQMVKDYLKWLETRKQIVKIDDIEMPKGDEVAVLKKLFQSANDAAHEKKFIDALNLYNKILKTYPGNKNAINGKKELFEEWLQGLKDKAGYFEMLGLLEKTIFPDESLKGHHNVFRKIFKDTVLLYAEVFLKNRIKYEMDGMKKELSSKIKRGDRFQKLLGDYQELTMEKEYDEVLKLHNKLMDEIEVTKKQIEVRLKLLEQRGIFKFKKKWETGDHPGLDILKTIVEEGVSDKYIVQAYNQIIIELPYNKFNSIMKLPAKGEKHIEKRLLALKELSHEYPDLMKAEIESAMKRLNSIAEMDRIWEMPENTLDEISIKLGVLKKIDKNEYTFVKHDFPGKINELEHKLELEKLEKWERRYNSYDSISMTLYILFNGYISFLVVKNYLGKGRWDNFVGAILFGLLVLCTFIFGFDLRPQLLFYGKVEKISKIIFIGIRKIFFVSLLPIIGYLNVQLSPDTFFNIFALLYLFAVFIIYRVFLLMNE